MSDDEYDIESDSDALLDLTDHHTSPKASARLALSSAPQAPQVASSSSAPLPTISTSGKKADPAQVEQAMENLNGDLHALQSQRNEIQQMQAELEGLRPPKEESLSTLSYCYVTDAQSSLVSTDADGSVDETTVSSTPTGQDGCVGVLRETMTPELANAFFHQETGSMKWIRKCSHSAEDYQDEQFTGFFGFFKNIGRYVIRRWIFEDRHCVPV